MKHDTPQANNSVSSQVQPSSDNSKIAIKTVEVKPEKKHSEKFMGIRPLWFKSSDDDAGVSFII